MAGKLGIKKHEIAIIGCVTLQTRIMYNTNGTDTSDITVPVVEITLMDYNRIKEIMLLDNQLYLDVTLNPGKSP